jgi:hypothetical protein
MDILGSWWKVIMTDITIGRSGNQERLAFLYDSRKISFGGLSGEVVIPPGKDSTPAEQLARTPFIVGFQAGWFKFTICVAHIYYGKSVKDDPRREREIKDLAAFLKNRATEQYRWAPNMILLGDFNIFNRHDVTFQAITDAGFVVPERLQSIPGSNALKNKHYDQIAFISPQIQNQLELCEGGVFDFYKYVYTVDEEKIYSSELKKNKRPALEENNDEDPMGRLTPYKTWRTFQMSDHLPMWVELRTDFGVEYLKAKQTVDANSNRVGSEL